MRQYFEGLIGQEEIKARFKDLAKENHPDCGGCVDVMKEINKQYDDVLSGIYQKAGKSITEIEELLKNSQAVRDKLCEIVLMPDVLVELCGEWLWVSGNTKPIKDKLKEAGFKWSKNKTAWYWRANYQRKFWRGNHESWDIERIRNQYGSQKVTVMGKRQAIA